MEKNVKNIKKNKNEKKKNISLSVCAVVIMGHKLLAFSTTYGIFRSDIRLCCVCGNFLQHFYIISFLYIIFFFFCAMLLPVYTLCVCLLALAVVLITSNRGMEPNEKLYFIHFFSFLFFCYNFYILFLCFFS